MPPETGELVIDNQITPVKRALSDFDLARPDTIPPSAAPVTFPIRLLDSLALTKTSMSRVRQISPLHTGALVIVVTLEEKDLDTMQSDEN